MNIQYRKRGTYVTLEECMEMFTDAKIVSYKDAFQNNANNKLIVKDHTLQQIWHDSKQTLIDTMKDKAALK